MAAGDLQDFRTDRFQQRQRFPGQGAAGGSGSSALPSFTPPLRQVQSSSPLPALSLPPFQMGSVSMPAMSWTGGSVAFSPTFSAPDPSLASSSIVVEDLATPGGPWPGITTLQFDGSVSATHPSADTVVLNVTGGGGGGTSLANGVILSSTRIGTPAAWEYSVDILGTVVVARNRLEKDNSATSAYGYTVTGGDRIVSGSTATDWYVYPVPDGVPVQLEQTADVDGTLRWWFTSPNRIWGAC